METPILDTLHSCEVSLAHGEGLIKFRVTCLFRGVPRVSGAVMQDQIGLVARRWLYMHSDPFTKTGDIGRTLGEDIVRHETY